MADESSESGFSVLEAIVAFAILSACLISLYGAIGAAYRAMRLAGQRQTLLAVAQSELEAARASSAPESEGRSGTISDGTRWHLRREPATNFATAKHGPSMEWLVFEAFGDNDEILIKLRTIKITPGR